jgi:hypothetical protein
LPELVAILEVCRTAPQDARLGYEMRSQLDRYRQMARTIKELDLGELEPLDELIPELYDSLRGIPQEYP